jgi:hypothetical protein
VQSENGKPETTRLPTYTVEFGRQNFTETLVLLSALKKVEEVAWAISHHLPVPLLSLSLDEALNVSALIAREIANGR